MWNGGHRPSNLSMPSPATMAVAPPWVQKGTPSWAMVSKNGSYIDEYTGVEPFHAGANRTRAPRSETA